MSSFVYAIQPIGMPIVKIGSTKDPMQRAESIAAFSPTQMRFRRLLDVGAGRRSRVWESVLLAWSMGCVSHGEWRTDLDVVDQLFDEVCPAIDRTNDFQIEQKASQPRKLMSDDEVAFRLLHADFLATFDGYEWEAVKAIGLPRYDVGSVARSKRGRERYGRKMQAFLAANPATPTEAAP